MAGIFISYRRDDSQGFAGRLSDDLIEALGADRVFRDVEIPVGHDFTTVLHRAVAACDVLIIVIGRNWQTPSNQGKRSRLFDPVDWVRAEIEAAFEQDKQIIPVLVGGAEMCAAADLPDSIADLSKLQAFSMHDRRWDDDIQHLLHILQQETPGLGKALPQIQDRSAETPAQVLRELGERVLDEVINKDNRDVQSGHNQSFELPGFVRGVGRLIRKTLISALLVAAIYIGLRLFGDADTLQMLDQIEARLQTGLSRLTAYFQNSH